MADARQIYMDMAALTGEGGSSPQTVDAIVAKGRQVAQLAPQEPDLLWLVAHDVYPYQSISGSAKQLMIDCQARVDNLGGPTDVLLSEIGGMGVYTHNRNLIASVSGGRLKAKV